MAWSGDVVLQLQLVNPDLRFVVPEEGGILWVTPMELLRTAQHPADAHAFLDLRLPAGDRDGASPSGSDTRRPCLRCRTSCASTPRRRRRPAISAYLSFLAESPLVFPTDDMLANLQSYQGAVCRREEQSWSNAFTEVLSG